MWKLGYQCCSWLLACHRWVGCISCWVKSTNMIIAYFPNRVYGFLTSQYLKHVRPFRDLPIFERFPVLISVTIIWIYSVILTASGAYRGKPYTTQISCRTDRANLISTAPWYTNQLSSLGLLCFSLVLQFYVYCFFRFKFPYPLQWGPPTFSAGHSFAMMSAVLVSMVEVYP